MKNVIFNNRVNIIAICWILSVSQVNAQPLPITNSYSSLDYSQLFYWAAHPDKKDCSDSIPSFLHGRENRDDVADVFFIHPTTYTQDKASALNADILNESLNNKTDESTILYQASAFNQRARVFAPRYRQAHIRAFYMESDSAAPYFELAYQDIKAAFDFYLRKYNNGRPIVIASHSQGTKHAGRLLKEYFEDKPLVNYLVCAYIIGMPIPDDYFKTLRPCTNPDQTGCFVGWRTFKEGTSQPEESFKSIVINPLTWTMDAEKASFRLNKGGVLKKFNKKVKQVVSAQIKGNILWSCKPRIFGKIFITQKNFHIGDINLFYMNIRENVSNRIDRFLSK